MPGEISPIYALGWADRKSKNIISNAGTTNPGNPSKRRRHKKQLIGGVYETIAYVKEVKRPQMIESFF